MGDYNKGGGFGIWKNRKDGSQGSGGSSRYNDDRGDDRGGSRRYGNDRGGRPDMHSATCAKCNSRCEVPFKPNGRKPIYCSDCFVRDDSGPRDHDRSRSYDRPRSFDKPRSFDRPRPHSKPAHHAAPSDNKDVVKQLKTIGIKMDRMIQLLSGLTEAMMEGIEEVDEEIESELVEVGAEIEDADIEDVDIDDADSFEEEE